MKDETTFQSIAEATTNGSDNVVEDFTSAEILPESNTDLTEDNETTEGQDETITEETDTILLSLSRKTMLKIIIMMKHNIRNAADETIFSPHSSITTDTDTNVTNESNSEEETSITETVMEKSTVSEILEDDIDTASMSVFDTDKAKLIMVAKMIRQRI